MDRKKRRKINRKMKECRPARLTPVPKEEWPKTSAGSGDEKREMVFHSKKYLVQVFSVSDGWMRMSVNRVEINKRGGWVDDISWDELQQIKRQCGFGDWYGIEIYPRDYDMVNVANLRHIWLREKPLSVGWKAKSLYEKIDELERSYDK